MCSSKISNPGNLKDTLKAFNYHSLLFSDGDILTYENYHLKHMVMKRIN